MAIEFVLDQKADLAIYILVGRIRIEDWLHAAKSDRFRSAKYALVDLRRCHLDGNGSMDLFHLASSLKNDLAAGRMVAGKTAIIIETNEPLFYHPAQRLFHHFLHLVSENELPRDFQLSRSLKDAFDWFGDPRLVDRYYRALGVAPSDDDTNTALKA